MSNYIRALVVYHSLSYRLSNVSKLLHVTIYNATIPIYSNMLLHVTIYRYTCTCTICMHVGMYMYMYIYCMWMLMLQCDMYTCDCIPDTYSVV